MTRFEEVINFLYAQLPVFHREGKKAYKPGLGNIESLSAQLGNPHEAFKSLHIAGTNGKGSSSHFMASILQEHGYKVGLYTSPHLKSFTERIKINGQEIDKQWIIDFFDKYQPLLNSIHPSFFEWTVIMAFQYFKEQQVDFAIIETGLGGRLDSTNIIHPLGCFITNIGFDHQDILGDSLTLIAGEKAGIIKAHTPICISEKQEETIAIFQAKANLEHANLRFASDQVQVSDPEFTKAGMQLEVETNTWGKFTLESPYAGIYQVNNLRGVIAWCEQLNELGIIPFELPKIQAGIVGCRENTMLRGRWEIYQENPWIIADTGHNESGISIILEQVKRYEPKQLTIVLGMVADKDIDRVLKLFPKDATYLFTEAHNPRALKADKLQEMASRHGLSGHLAENVNQAIEHARNTNSDFILITGSTYLVAEIEETF
ncbi:MAG: Dihydrofolate synthase [Bacteroidota bacterium]|jgi:dihydrofolate synthase / folylpolyglutamate synthase